MLESVVALSDREAVAGFEEATKLTLPDRAPEIWMERDRRSGEDAIQFLRRVWGPYMDAGILYQDQIKRLGDDRLVQAVRDACCKLKLHAASILPPPRHVRYERAAREAGPDAVARRRKNLRASMYSNALQQYKKLRQL